MQSSWRTCVLNTPPPVSQSFSISARARSCFAPLLRSWAYTRMLVSTKHLSLMQFAARTGSCPAQIQSYAEPRHSPPSSAIISLTFSHEFLELGGKEPADRTAFFRSQDPRLFQNLSVELQSDICFHGCTIPRATQFYVPGPPPSTPLSLLVDIRPAWKQIPDSSWRCTSVPQPEPGCAIVPDAWPP